MNIWYTTTPKDHDYPIWAYIGEDASDVVLLRKPEEAVIEGLTWTHARVPEIPTKDNIRDQVDIKFQELADSNVSDYWSSSDWFRAGYKYGLDNLIDNNTDKPI